jgi:hypothetical protein
MDTVTYGDNAVLLVDELGGALSTPDDATTLLEAAFSEHATVVAVPAGRFDPLFFDLSTGLAGEFLQKFVTYRIAIAIVGDISETIAGSAALSAFVVESNRGAHVWFVPDVAAIESLVGRLDPR